MVEGVAGAAESAEGLGDGHGVFRGRCRFEICEDEREGIAVASGIVEKRCEGGAQRDGFLVVWTVAGDGRFDGLVHAGGSSGLRQADAEEFASGIRERTR